MKDDFRLPEELRNLARQPEPKANRESLVAGLTRLVTSDSCPHDFTFNLVRGLAAEGWDPDEARGLVFEVVTAADRASTTQDSRMEAMETVLSKYRISGGWAGDETPRSLAAYLDQQQVRATPMWGADFLFPGVFLVGEPIDVITIVAVSESDTNHKIVGSQFRMRVPVGLEGPSTGNSRKALSAQVESIPERSLLGFFGLGKRGGVKWVGRELAHSLNQDTELTESIWKHLEALPGSFSIFGRGLRVGKSDVSDSDCPVIYTPQFLSLGEEPLRFPIYRKIAEHVHHVARDVAPQD